jgi:hypothetical protein
MDANRCPCIKRSQHRPQLESVLDNAKNVKMSGTLTLVAAARPSVQRCHG